MGFIHRNKGMTLLELMVAMGVLGIIGYISVDGLVQSMSLQKNVAIKDDANQFGSSISLYLSNQSFCTSEFKNTSFPVSGSRELAINNYQGFGDYVGPITKDVNLTNTLRIKKIDLHHQTNIPVQNIQYGGGTDRIFVARVEMQLQLSQQGKNPKDLPPVVTEFPVVVDSGNLIKGCQVGFDMENACQAMGMAFNESLGECIPETSCSVTGSFVKTTCTPSNYGCSTKYSNNNPVTGGEGCPSGSSPRMTGELVYSHSVSCGKKCSASVQNQVQFFLCMRCQ